MNTVQGLRIVVVVSFAAEPLSLMELSRAVIRSQLSQRRFKDIQTLPLPKALKLYLVSH